MAASPADTLQSEPVVPETPAVDGDASPVAQPASARVAPPARRVAALVYIVCVVIYAAFASDRLLTHSPDNHFSYLADAYLHGQLSVRCDPAETARNTCPPGGGGNDWARYEGKWFVTFPSLPAVAYMPAVAMFGRDFRNRAYDVMLAGFAPALLYLFLERLSRKGRSPRTWRENLAFTMLFAFGSVYFFVAVQGAVWFTAQLLSCALAVGYLWFGLDAERPFLAGLCLALAIHSRADFVYASPLFAIEVLRTRRLLNAPAIPGRDAPLLDRARAFLRGVDWKNAMKALVAFGIPVAAAVTLTFVLNKLRFGEYGEVGYRFLQIRWRDRIDRWGLFNYHYLGRNLGVAVASLPWFSRQFPYVIISLHGLAVWVTTPLYLELIRLRRRAGDTYTPFLAWTAVALALSVLFYQSTGWIQFGYRYSNDFAVFLIVLLAINGRKIGKTWLALLAVAILVNAFGALTFDREMVIRGRHLNFYDSDNSQLHYFQPD